MVGIGRLRKAKLESLRWEAKLYSVTDWEKEHSIVLGSANTISAKAHRLTLVIEALGSISHFTLSVDHDASRVLL